MIPITLLCNFIEIALLQGCSPVDLLYILRTPFPKNNSERLLLSFCRGWHKKNHRPTCSKLTQTMKKGTAQKMKFSIKDLVTFTEEILH